MSGRVSASAIRVGGNRLNQCRQCWRCTESCLVKQIDGQMPYLGVVVVQALDQAGNQAVAIPGELDVGNVFWNPLLGVVQDQQTQKLMAYLGHDSCLLQ